MMGFIFYFFLLLLLLLTSLFPVGQLGQSTSLSFLARIVLLVDRYVVVKVVSVCERAFIFDLF